jgi:hypothetical protein
MDTTLTYEKILDLFKRSDERFEERLKKEAEARKAFDKEMKELHKEIGGIGKSNGAIAEDFFYTGLSNTMKVANLYFDYIDRNLNRKRNNLQGEYDIVLYNNYKVMVVEVKYKFRIDQLLHFYKDSLKNFKKLFPQYKQYKIYGAVAGLTFEKGFFEEAQSYGFYVLTQDNDKIQILNTKDFIPNEIK